MRKRKISTRNSPVLERMTIRALTVRASTADDKTRSVDAVLATSKPVEVGSDHGFETMDEVLRIDGVTVAGGASVPLLADHDHYQIDKVRGSVRNIRADGEALIGTLVFASDSNSVDAYNKVRDGHITDVSAGYVPTDYQDIHSGETAEVDGTSYTAAQRTLRVTRGWTLKEVSLVPIGADPASKIRRSPRRRSASTKEQIMDYNERQLAFLRDLGLAADADRETVQAFVDRLSDEERAVLADRAVDPETGEEVPDEEAAPAAEEDEEATEEGARSTDRGTMTRTATNPQVLRQRAAQAERMRIRRINELADMAGPNLPSAIRQRAINEGWDLGRAMTAFRQTTNDLTHRAVDGTLQVTSRQQDRHREAVTLGLMQRCGHRVTHSDAVLLEESRRFARCGIQQIAQIALGIEGIRHEVHWSPDELFRRSISTFSFANILGTSFNKVLLDAYAETPDTVSAWASDEAVRDFKTYNFLKMGKFASVPKVGAGGELTHGTLEESNETGSASTYGVLFAFTRRDFINDDLGAFGRVPAELGAAAMRNKQDIVYDLLISASGVGPTMNEDSKALFHASHTDGANYQTGAGSALQSSSLTTAKKNIRKMKQGAAYLNLMPSVILVPPELEHTAKELVESSEIIIAGQTSGTVRGNKNTHQGGLQVVVEPRLSDATNGTTAWYLVCPPNQARSIAVLNLQGNATPVVERADPPSNVLGIGWRMYHDIGAAAVDFRGINRSKGA